MGLGDQGRLGMEREHIKNNEFMYNQQKLIDLKFYRQWVPRRFTSLEKKIIRVSCGLEFTCVIDVEFNMYTFGSNSAGQLGVGRDPSAEPGFSLYLPTNPMAGKKVLSVACGDQHVICLTVENEVYVCGSNEFGQMGLNLDPSKLKLRNKYAFIRSLIEYKILNVFAGPDCCAVITQDLEILFFGSNLNGKLGTGDESVVFKPTFAQSLRDKFVYYCSMNS